MVVRLNSGRALRIEARVINLGVESDVPTVPALQPKQCLRHLPCLHRGIHAHAQLVAAWWRYVSTLGDQLTRTLQRTLPLAGASDVAKKHGEVVMLMSGEPVADHRVGQAPPRWPMANDESSQAPERDFGKGLSNKDMR